MSLFKQWPVFFLLLAFAIAPLFHGSQTGILAGVHILVLAVFFKVFLASYQEFRIPYNSLAFFICLFYIWMALTISWSPAPSISLYMFIWLSIFPICFFIYSLKQPGDWPYLPTGILCVTLIFSFIGIWQGVFTEELPQSLFRTRNTYPAMLNLIVLPSTAYFLYRDQLNNRLSILLGIILFVLFFAVFQTGSKGATISLLLGLVFTAVTSWKFVNKFSLLKVLITIVVAFSLADIQTDTKNLGRNHNVIDRLYQALDQDRVLDEGRLVIWRSAWKIVKSAPIIGTGIGAYHIVLPPYRDINDPNPGSFIHNDFLQLWLETGLIGLTLLLMIMVAMGRFFIIALKDDDLKIPDRLEIIGLFAGLIAVSLHSFVDFNFYILAILMVMGFMCARIQEISGQYYSEFMRSIKPAQKLSKKIFVLAACIIPIIILNYSLPVAMADFYWNKAKKQFTMGQVHNSLATLDLAAKWNPNSLRIRFQQVECYRNILKMIKNEALPAERKELMASALIILKIIEGINTYDGYAPENRGNILIENSDIAADDWREKAVHEFKKALRFHPRQYRARTALVKLLEEEGRLDEAVRLMNDGVRYHYDIYLTGLGEFYQYAVKLNLMSGDTVKAKDIQGKIDDINRWNSEQKIFPGT